MLKQIEGSRAVAETVAMCRPQVICAYPITPQTRIVEALGAMVKKGELNAEFLNVESEFAAMSVAIGSSAAGARAYTAIASQGLLYMSEAVYNAAGLGLPVVMCMDGFLLTHASERVDLPKQEQVDAFFPPYEPRQVLDPDDPVSIGAMVGPEAFTEVRYLAFERMRRALEVISAVEADFGAQFGRGSGGLVKLYRTDDADLIVVALGSVLGTVKDAIDELRDDGVRVGALGITTFRPFPAQAVRDALGDDNRLRRLVVLERSLAPGAGGVVTADLRTALATGDGGPRDAIISTVIAGLGGRPVTRRSLRRMLTRAARGELPEFSFLDLDTHLVEGELTRIRAARRPGPSAENILRAFARRS